MFKPEITIGGSEAAAAVGVDPFKSRVRLWAEKTGKIAREEPGEWATWGTLLEPVIRGVCISSLGYLPADGVHTEYIDGWKIGHPDGGIYDSIDADLADLPGVLEVKTTGIHRHEQWADDNAPVPYVIQCHWYMHLIGLDWSLLACLIAGQRLELRKIERDRQIEEAMLTAAQEFYDLCVSDTPPESDGSKSSTELLKLLYPKGQPDAIVQATADDYAAVLALAKIKAQLKAVSLEEARLENVIKQRMGDASVLVYDGARIASWPTIHAERKPNPGGPYEYRRFTVGVKA